MKAKKLLACMLAVFCMASSMGIVTYANESIAESYIDSDYGVYSLYLKDSASNLTISGTTATCKSEAYGGNFCVNGTVGYVL